MKPILNSLSVWFGLIMVLIVLAGAIAFTFTDLMSDRLFGTKRTLFILMLVAYAIYRGFRLYQIFKQSRYEE